MIITSDAVPKNAHGQGTGNYYITSHGLIIMNALKCKRLVSCSILSFVVRCYILNMHSRMALDMADKNAQFVHSWPVFRPSSFLASSPGPPSFSLLHTESIEKLGGPGDEAIDFLCCF